MKNETIDHGDHVEIIVLKRNMSCAEKVKIDKEDMELFSNNKVFTSKGYARTVFNGKITPIHRMIIKSEDEIDHINRDKLDNRKINLRPATRVQNIANTPGRSKTGYKGVVASKKRFWAKIKKDGKSITIGFFNTPEEAALAYNEKAKVIFGDFAFQNTVPDIYPKRSNSNA